MKVLFRALIESHLIVAPNFPQKKKRENVRAPITISKKPFHLPRDQHMPLERETELIIGRSGRCFFNLQPVFIENVTSAIIRL